MANKLKKSDKELLRSKIADFKCLDERESRIVWSYLGSYYLEFCCAYVKEMGAVAGLHELLDIVTLIVVDEADRSGLSKAIDEKIDGFAEVLLTIDLASIHKNMLRNNIEFIIPSDVFWPHRLHDLSHYEPIGLYVRGNRNLHKLCGRSIAIVGSRNATIYGKKVTNTISYELARNGWTICSGGALGIDISAHNAMNSYLHKARTAGEQEVSGSTESITQTVGDYSGMHSVLGNVAFMASGVDDLTPTGNIGYFEDMLNNGGTFVSEYPLGSHPTSFRYLERNRLIAAFSKATIVVEAAFRSGALNTVSFAHSLSRPVGALPGPVNSTLSVGTHKLIRDSQAVLVTCAKHCIALAHDKFDGDPPPHSEAKNVRGGDDVLRLFEKKKTATIEDVQKTLQLSEGECKGVCTQLVLNGVLKKGKRVNTWVLSS